MTILLFIIGLSLTGCNTSKDRKFQKDLSKSRLNADIVTFTFQAIPSIYSGLVKLNNEILLIDNELKRLKKIETKYPRQQRIVAIEKENWKKIQRNLFKELGVLEKDIEKIYVTYLVNKEKGKTLIKEKTKPIFSAIKNAIKTSTPHTRRLQPTPKKSFIVRMKAKFLS